MRLLVILLFLGGHRIRKELGDEYTEKLFDKFNDLKINRQYTAPWFQLAHQI